MHWLGLEEVKVLRTCLCVCPCLHPCQPHILPSWELWMWSLVCIPHLKGRLYSPGQ